MLYTRRQLCVLLVGLAAAGGGLAIGRWRRSNPDIVEHVERLDRTAAPAPSVAAPQPESRLRTARFTSEAEPRRARRGRAPRDTPSAPIASADTAPSSENGHSDRTAGVSTPCP